MTASVEIRPYAEADWKGMWPILQATIQAGDTYVFDPGMSRDEALAYWFHTGNSAWVLEEAGSILGIYIVKPNQPALGSHVANAAFMVSPAARGAGVGRRMGEHCLAQARAMGFRAMQFNFVVSTNEAAVRLWKQLGFEIVGTLPGAFRHATLGYVDAYVMFRKLA